MRASIGSNSWPESHVTCITPPLDLTH